MKSKNEFLKSMLGLSAIFVMLAGYVFLSASCGGGGGGNDDDSSTVSVDANHTTFLKSISSKVLMPTLQDFLEKTEILKTKLQALENEIVTNSGDGGEFLTAAQDAWKDAMLVWESLEMLEFGPAGSSSVSLGGKGYRDEIYSWPTTSTCAIDQVIVNNEFKTANFLDSKLINIYGLDALEYLLFYQELDNSCAAQIDINADATWLALTEDEIYLRRAEFAVVIATKIDLDARALLNEWKSTGENFIDSFDNAGIDKSIYSTSQKAVNAVFAGLFYLDLNVKDVKIAKPFSLGSASTTTLDASKLEFKYASFNQESVVANIKMFKLVFQGGEHSSGYGLEDLLIANNASSTATEILSQINVTISAFEALASYETIIISNDTTAIASAYEELKKLTILMKEDLVVALSLEIPNEGAGDND